MMYFEDSLCAKEKGHILLDNKEIATELARYFGRLFCKVSCRSGGGALIVNDSRGLAP